jgi:hypothetical protein
MHLGSDAHKNKPINLGTVEQKYSPFRPWQLGV